MLSSRLYGIGGARRMNFMDEVNEETQAMLKQITIRKAEKTSNAKKRIAELKKLIKFWEESE